MGPGIGSAVGSGMKGARVAIVGSLVGERPNVGRKVGRGAGMGMVGVAVGIKVYGFVTGRGRTGILAKVGALVGAKEGIFKVSSEGTAFGRSVGRLNRVGALDS